MARDPAMVCTCCGEWRVVLIKIDRAERRRPHQFFRIVGHGTIVREVETVAEVDEVLKLNGIDMADFVETEPATP